MPAFVHFLRELRRTLSRRRIERGYRRILQLFNRLIRVEEEREQVERRERSMMEPNEPFDLLDTRRVTTARILLLAIPAAYLIDLCLLSDLVTWLAAGAFPKNSVSLAAVKFAIPAAIVIIEIGIGTMLVILWQQRQWIWLLCVGWLACMMTVAMPSVLVAKAFAKQAIVQANRMAAATHVEEAVPTIAGLEPKIFWTTVPLLMVALVAHALLVFGGRPAHDAKSYVLFASRKKRLDRRLRALRGSETALRTQGAPAFREYLRGVSDHRTRFNDMIPAGPFPHRVARRINREFEQRVIETSPDIPEPNPSVDAENLHAAEIDYDEQRIRHAESELRP